MRVALLHNPHAGNSDRTAQELLQIMKRHGFKGTLLDYDELERQLRGDRTKISADLIAVAGGDGSVKRAACILAQTGLPLAMVPLGTANNIATCLGIAGEPERIIRAWKTGSVRSIDLGHATGPWGQRFYIESAGIGLIARMIAVMKRIGHASVHELSERQDRVFRDRAVLAAMAHEYSGVDVRARVDRHTFQSGKYLFYELLNLRRSGPGIKLTTSQPWDGTLDLAAVRSDRRDQLIGVLFRALSETVSGPWLPVRAAKKVEVELGDFEVRIDDEITWTPRQFHAARRRLAPAVFECVPGALECLLPKIPAKF